MGWIVDISALCLDWFKLQGDRVIDNGGVSEQRMAKTLRESRYCDRIHSVLDCVLSLKIDGDIDIFIKPSPIVDKYLNLLSTLRKLQPQTKKLLFKELRSQLEKFGDNIQLTFLSAVHVVKV